MAIFLTEKKTNHRRISDPQIIYDGALCDNIISGSHFTLQCSSNLDDEGIVKLPLHAISFSSHEKIGSMGEEKNSEDSSISHIGTLFLFSMRGKIIYCFLCWETVLLRYTHLYSDVSAKCYLNQKSYFGSIRINCKGVQSLEICHIETSNLFSHQFWFKKLRFQPRGK